MRNITHTSWKKKIVRTVIASMSLGLLLTGCIHQPGFKPIAGVSPQEPKQEAERQCRAEATSSMEEKFDRYKKTIDTHGEAGREAGTISDSITKDDDDSGARTGKAVGNIIGMIAGAHELYQKTQAEHKDLKVCMHEKGYDVIGS